MKSILTRNKIRYLPIMFILALVLTATAASMLFFVPKNTSVVTAEDAVDTYNIYGAEDLARYAKAYAAGNRNKYDTLKFFVTSGDYLSDGDYVSIGTSARPFSGEIYISTLGLDTFYLYDSPLFDYVSTEMTVTGTGLIKIKKHQPGGMLFANHVVREKYTKEGELADGEATWNISFEDYDGIGENDYYAGLIGDIGDGCDVTVNYTVNYDHHDLENHRNLEIISDGNAGLVCGTLGLSNGANLTVSVYGTASGVDVSSTGGHAGGLVGKINTGSTFTLNDVSVTVADSVTANGSGKYAGGIAGYVDDAEISFGEDFGGYTVEGSVTGVGGAGGLFGYYRSEDYAATSLSLANYTINSGLRVSSSGNSGGIIGTLENNAAAFTYNGNAENTTETVSGSSYCGGVIGYYITDALTGTLTVTNVNNRITVGGGGTSGGIIGGISKNAAYVLIDGETGSITTNSNANGGIIGTESSGGSFIDVKGEVTISGSHNGGIVATMNAGVLRLKGYTDLSGSTISIGDGVIVKNRGRSLIYALGSGTDYVYDDSDPENITITGWSVKRANNVEADDIYTWGQVVRVGATYFTESDLFTVDMTEHTVTVESASASFDTKAAFALTALNIQLNTAAAVGSLQFASVSDSSSGSANLLASNLTLSASIDMSNTGITGLTRDDGGNNVYTGTTFSGGGNKLTLDVGAAYGDDSSVGGVHNHAYTGLFAKAGKDGENGVTFSNLTIAGTMNVRAGGEEGVRYAGSVVAHVVNKITLTSVTVSPTVSLKNFDKASLYIGGAVGNVDINGKVTVSGGTYGAAVTDVTAADVGYYTIYGGIVGNLAGSTTASSTQTIEIGSNALLSSSYTKTQEARKPFFGAAIGRIEHANYVKDRRTVTINSVDVNFTASATPIGRKIGGILGTEWYATDVTVTALRIDNTSITANTNPADMGGLVQYATGHWDVISLSVDADNDHDVVLTAPSNSTFGFVANKAYHYGDTAATRSALYLDVNNKDDNYNIGNLYIGASNNLSGNFTVFDELVADSRFHGADITNNGNAVISVTTTDGELINFDNTACNTYQNKTAAGKAHVLTHALNGNTRYYYNLKAIRTGSPDDAQNFLIWSVKTYAQSSLSAWFTSSSSFTGTLDMTGYSYYPVKLNGASVTFTSASLTLNNNGIEAAEGYDNGSDDLVSRGTRTSSSQHYLMHTSTFIDVTGRISVNGLTISGNVPKLSDSYCGFLIAGTLGGATSGVVTHNDGVQSNIVFNGAYITVGGDHLDDDTYAPLLINKALRNSTVTIDGASQSSYSSYGTNGWYAASSLIGDVGAADAKSIRLTFTKLKFDGRISDTSDGDFYGTDRSIFSRATILNSFLYLEQGSGTYNFTWDDDWTNDAHNVTYGAEITGTKENRVTPNDMSTASKQNKYYSDAYRYVDPTKNNNTSSQYGSFGDFLPYVYTTYNSGLKQHELAVNIFVAVANITGCGKYGDPYVITDGNMLDYVAKVINGSVTDTTTGLTLPKDLVITGETQGTAGTAVDHPALGTLGTDYDVVYKYNGSGYFTATGQTNVPIAAVRKYLAGAYYQVKSAKIELPTSFPGLGLPGNGDENPEYYAFRGVIVGHPDYDNVISNASIAPLVYNSNGCVVKDVTVEVNCASTIEFNYEDYTGSFEYLSGSKAYGAVIGQVMGGDTVIDNVDVTYATATFSFNDTVYTRLAPVGGYIGVVLNGGVIFRNMAGKAPENFDSKLDRVNDSGYLYVNPIIGRVIAGYAFHETTAYHTTETASTLKNTNKNYSIPDFKSTTPFNVLGVSGNTINVLDGQSLFILSLIVNSGAGAAPNAIGDYDALSGYWQAYRAYCATRSTAEYNDLGHESADYTLSTSDGYLGLNRTPYIITKYSTADARFVSSNTSSTIEIKGDCELPESFRGIGSIYINDPLVRINASYFRGYNGTQRTITLNTRYVEYNIDRSDGNLSYKFYYESKNYGYWEETSIRSIGIINQFIGTASTGAITLNISNLKLAGSVYADLLNRETGAEFTEYLFSSLAIPGGKTDAPLPAPASNGIGGINGVSVTVGGFVGCVYNNGAKPTVNFTNIDFDGISVQGPKWAGGLVGAGRGDATVSFTNCDTINSHSISVKAGHQAGGLIGRSRQIAVNVNSSSGSSTLKIGEIVCMGKTSGATINDVTYSSANHDNAPGDNSGQNEEAYSCGGVTAYSRQNAITVKNLTLTGGWIKHNVMANDDKIGFAGGVLGHNFQTRFAFTSITVSGVNFDAEVVGGLIGGIATNLQADCFIRSCTVDGLNTATIEGRNKAGGVFGILQVGQNNRSVEISKTTVKRYNISQTYEIASGENYASAGGLCAHVLFSSHTGISLKLFDDCVTDCTISSAYTEVTTGRGTGGLIGVVTSNARNVNGYNLFVNNTTISSNVENSSNSTQNCGIFVGRNDANCIFKLVGITFKDITKNGINPMTGERYITAGALLKNGSSYAVFADFAGETDANAFSPVNNASNVSGNNPYVTTNPSETIGTLSGGTPFVLTGDGVALTVPALPIQSILNDTATGRYSYAANNRYSADVSTTNYALFNESYKDKFSMFSTEALSYTGEGKIDFPVLVIDYNDNATITKMLNSYLRLLTNTRISFADSTDQTNYNFSVNFYCATYSGSTFTCDPISNLLVTCSGKQFVITRDYYDSGKNQFMLIDVAFKNPANTSQVAYHLYVPVFVQRVLNYRFDIAIRSGTTYIESNYSGHYGDMLIENVGSPVTVYFKYTYQRTAEDWISFINEGEDVHRNFTKTLEFKKANDSAILDALPSDTVLVLLDPNSGRSYYATVGDAVSGTVLSLSAFKSTMVKDGDNITCTGESFAPMDLYDLIDKMFSVEEDDQGSLIECAEGDATVKIGGTYYCPYVSGSMQRYSAVGSIVERYYLSIFTESSEDFHHYIITSPKTFGDPSYPSVISDTLRHTSAHLVMGKIFDQSAFSITSKSKNATEQEDVLLMTSDNNRLIITATATMGVSASLGNLREEVKGFVGDTSVYQSFVVYLNRTVNNNTVKAILGDPSGAGSYYQIGDGEEVSYATDGTIRITQNCAEFVSDNLSETFATEDTFTISANIWLTYSSEAVATQFPGISSSAPDNGVTVSGASNIAFSESSTTYSENSQPGAETPAKTYYSEADAEVAILDLNPIGDKVGEFTALGINALNNKDENGNDSSVAHFNLLAVLDANAIYQQIEGYDDAVITITLNQKQDDGTYGAALPVSDYMELTVEGIDDGDIADNGTSFSVVVEKDNPQLTDLGSAIVLPVLHFGIITGADFEAAGLKYGNYRVTVSAVLRDELGNEYSVSRVSNFIIYTNAKIIPEYIQ